MGQCPYDACENCLLGGQLEECHFWSPIQHTCALSSKYEENEMEYLYLDHLRRSRKMSDDEWTLEDFKERMKEMESLKKGWLDGDGKAISKEVIDLVQDEVLKRLSFCAFDAPSTNPFSSTHPLPFRNLVLVCILPEISISIK